VGQLNMVPKERKNPGGQGVEGPSVLSVIGRGTARAIRGETPAGRLGARGNSGLRRIEERGAGLKLPRRKKGQ